jgi:ribonuclease HI
MGSAKFLESYDETLTSIRRRGNQDESDKGKRRVDGDPCSEVIKENQANGEADRRKKWKPPQMRWVKLNTDAGFCPTSGKASTGIVVRDPPGKILLTAWRTFQSCGSPEEAGAEACLQGIRLVAQWIKQPTHIETDCQTLVKAIEVLEPDRASWTGLVEEIQAVKNLLPACTFKHIRREDNRAAHLLAACH